MNAPFYEYGLFGEGTLFLVALGIGFFFGFFLERGGLGNPHKLTGVFYLRDFTVPQVMFTAILVASTGLYLLSDLGMLDIERLWLVPTYFWPQIMGGAIFGLGFLVSGYCPGTSVAALASGRLDALVTMLGMSVGSFLFAVLFPSIEGFYGSSSQPAATLQGLSGLSHWVVIAFLFVMAGTMFFLIERFGKINGK